MLFNYEHYHEHCGSTANCESKWDDCLGIKAVRMQSYKLDNEMNITVLLGLVIKHDNLGYKANQEAYI